MVQFVDFCAIFTPPHPHPTQDYLDKIVKHSFLFRRSPAHQPEKRQAPLSARRHANLRRVGPRPGDARCGAGRLSQHARRAVGREARRPRRPRRTARRGARGAAG